MGISEKNNQQPSWKRVVRKHSIEEFQKFAEARGGRCLSKVFESLKKNLEFECSNGHRWQTRADNVLKGNHWCPYCNRKRLDYDKVQKMCNELGYVLLSKAETSRDDKKVYVQCPNRHVFLVRKHDITIGRIKCKECLKLERYKNFKAKCDREGIRIIGSHENGIEQQEKIEIVCPEGHHRHISYFPYLKEPYVCKSCLADKSSKAVDYNQ